MQKLTPEEWKHVLELLDTGLELPALEREAWFAALDESRASLKPALRELLARHATKETDDFLRALPQFTRIEIDVDSIAGELKPDADIGAYRLIRELGRGGMSAVWLAERIDGKFKRQVALKFPYAGPAQRELAERLRRERDILASLEHQNIARLYDADVTESGQPFLVLEYVDGIPINVHCERRQLSLRERLVLFLQVFNAVQYAHAHLVIHRDLKPSNILVTADGVVHLLDFGIAKLIKEGGVEATPLTEFGARALTPDYASPEQIAGQSLTTSSDIYSLGVVLYELLTGSRPYRLKRDSRASLEEAIAEADVIAPSRALSDAAHVRQLARSLRGDLDTIVLKALKKTPADRYVSVDAFAKDIAHYLDGEAVSARPDSRWYRARKLIGRNRLAAGAAASVVLALGVGLTIALWQLQVARAERQRAEDVKEFVASIFSAADPYLTGNQSMTAVDLLALARQRIDRELAAHPENAVELLVKVGESQKNLEQLDAARATLEKAIERGTAALPPNHFAVLEAKAQLASVLGKQTDYAAAKPLLAEVIPLLRRSAPRGARVLAGALQVQATIASEELDTDTAIASGREAVAIDTAALGAQHFETIMAKRNLAGELLFAGRIPEALPIAAEAYRDARAKFPEGGSNGLLVDTEDLYGQVLAQTDQVEQAIEHLRHAIAAAESLYGTQNQSIAGSMSFLVLAQSRAGDFDGMFETTQRYLGAAASDRGRARARVFLGNALLLARRMPDAVEELAEAVAAIRKFDTGKGSWLGRAQANYGHALVQAGRISEAQQLLQENLQALRDSKKTDVVLTLNAIGLAERVTGHPTRSEISYRQALERVNESVQQARWKAESLNGIGLAQLDQGHALEAEGTLREADTAARIYFLKITPPRADVIVSLGRAVLQQGRPTEALPLLAEADAYWRGFNPAHRCAGEAAYWYGRAQLAQGATREGRESLARAARILASSPFEIDAPLAVDARNRMAATRL